MNNNLLPIGTVIKTYKYPAKYIILGSFCKKDEVMYTYYCCKYPYGYIIDDGSINDKIKDYDIYINQEDIEEILFIGNQNSEV